MLYMKTLALIISMGALLLTAVLRGLFSEGNNKAEAWTTAAFVMGGVALAAVLVWSGL